jgi:hypothetical protein
VKRWAIGPRKRQAKGREYKKTGNSEGVAKKTGKKGL